MNPWGDRAMEHWKSHLPERYAALDDPVTYFTRIGEDAAARSHSLTTHMCKNWRTFVGGGSARGEE